MTRITRMSLLALLLAASALTLPNEPLAAQATEAPEAQAPEAFVPSEKLPADAAVSLHSKARKAALMPL